MKITNKIPVNSKDLQNIVCKILNEAGYLAKSSETVQDNVEVDVIAYSKTEILKQFICECKYWDTQITKEQINKFFKTVSDSGSMLGIIISNNDYSQEAYEAANYSNVILKDFNEFVELIEKQWIRNQSNRIDKSIYPLSIYTDPLNIPFNDLTKDELAKYKELNEKILNACIIYRDINEDLHQQDHVVINGQTFTALDELYDYLDTLFSRVIKELEDLLQNYTIPQSKFDL